MTASVLVVEDEPTVARLIALLLREAGCAVTIATDPSNAIRDLGQTGFDLLIAKLEPPVDGPRLVRELRAMPDSNGMCVIFTSIYPEPPVHDADEFLQRPFDPDKLLEAVTRVLAMREATRAADGDPFSQRDGRM